MSTRGWENATLNDVRDRRVPKKPAKYGNVKTVVDGIKFDSKREAGHWIELKAQERAGDIRKLERQVEIDLLTPVGDGFTSAVVCVYIADFTFEELERGVGGVKWTPVVADSKGKRTQMYQLKKKWLRLQSGIEIREL